MEQADFERVAASFAAFHAEFAPLFGRVEAQQRSDQYVRGLLVQQADRRNAENVAETIEGATPRSLQRLLTEAPWPTEPVIDRLQAYVGARLNAPDGVFVIDESGFPKQGTKSVGVARQYCGTLGKVGNCQLGVFLSYASPRGHALVDKRVVPAARVDGRPGALSGGGRARGRDPLPEQGGVGAGSAAAGARGGPPHRPLGGRRRRLRDGAYLARCPGRGGLALRARCPGDDARVRPPGPGGGAAVERPGR